MMMRLCFLLGSLGLSFGAQFKNGDTRVVMMMPKNDGCRMDDMCSQGLNFDANEVLNTKSYQDMGAADMSPSMVSEGGNVRGRKLCNAACVEQYGLYICILYGWCRRRELADAFAPAPSEDPVLTDLREECWAYRGVEMDAAFTSLMPDTVSGYSTAGVSYRTQIYICGDQNGQ